jgi:hypothetical protein
MHRQASEKAKERKKVAVSGDRATHNNIIGKIEKKKGTIRERTGA